MCVCELTALLNVSQPAISQHLRKLKLLNIVKERKNGQWVYYSLREPKADEVLLTAIIDHLPDVTYLFNKLQEEKTSCKVEEIKQQPIKYKNLTI